MGPSQFGLTLFNLPQIHSHASSDTQFENEVAVLQFVGENLLSSFIRNMVSASTITLCSLSSSAEKTLA